MQPPEVGEVVEIRETGGFLPVIRDEQLPETRSPCDDAQAEQNEDPRTGLRDRNEEVHAESPRGVPSW